MIFILKDGIPLFVPALFPTKSTLDSWPWIRLLYVLESFFIITMLPGAIILMRSSRKTLPLVHRNLIQILQVHLIALVVSEITRALIILYDAGLLDNTATGSFDYSLFILFAIRFVSLTFLVTIIPAAITERVFASHYISDYESVNRSWISYLVNGGSLIVTAVYYMLLQSIAISSYLMFLLLFVTMLTYVLPALAMLVIYRRDVSKLRDLKNQSGRSTINYTLGLKFQLEENIRVSKFLSHASFGCAAWGILGSFMATITFAVFKETNPISQILAILINVYIAMTVAVLVWLSVAAIGKSKAFKTFISKCTSRVAAKEEVRSANLNAEALTERHFKQLESIWAQSLNASKNAHLIAFTVTQASRVFIMLYELEVIGTKGSVDTRLFLLYFARYMPLSCLQTMIPAIAAERTFASRYISDYERQNRLWVSYTVIGIALMLAVLLNALVQLVSIGEDIMFPLAALSLSITVFSLVAMIVVHRRDAAKLRDLESMTGYSTLNYTLSMKFQLAENVRVTKWLTYSSVGYAVWAFIGAFFAFPPLLVFDESELIGQVLYEVLNIYFALTFAIVIWLSLAASGELRRFSTLLPLRCSRRISNALYLNTVPIKSNDTLIATELYFKHLKSAWGPD